MADTTLTGATRMLAMPRIPFNLISGLILLAFVVAHLAGHAVLLVSLRWAEPVQALLMSPWRSAIGSAILGGAAIFHFGSALLAVYRRRTLRMARWEIWQLILGLSIPALLMTHVIGTRVSELALGTRSFYATTLVSLWIAVPWLGLIQALALIVVWTHACIGVHFWLRVRPHYTAWRPLLGIVALLLPAFALAGFVSGGNQVLRDARADPLFVAERIGEARQTPQTFDRVKAMTIAGYAFYAALLALPFGARSIRGAIQRRRRSPRLTLPSGKRLTIHPGASVLETLRENGVPHASICGGRARCTTCRVLVTMSAGDLPPAQPREARALERIDASPDTRLACQLRPTSDIAVMPLLAPYASALDGAMRGGLEGSERLITVLFVDLRGSTALSEQRLPYDLMFLLNQFFHEMTQALTETNGHYSQFTGDGLMALYGLRGDPAAGAADALRGADAMLRRLQRLNETLGRELREPLRIGIGIHHAEAIVGTMGPPNSQIVSAIGDTVNVCARLENLSKTYGCPLIVSREAAQAARLDTGDATLHDASVSGRRGTVRFYAFAVVPEFLA